MGLVVQKFGGSSVATAERVLEAARKAIRARHLGNSVIIVVSAQGSTTDDLIAKANEISASPSAREMDMLLATGEQISIALTAMAVQELGEKAISFLGPQIGLVTDNTHRKARIKSIDTRRISKALEEGHIVVLAGFQGMDEAFDITTLGRGGSDTTAVAVAAAMKQAGYDVECEIYTDVDGVYTTDPRIVPDARKMDVISYDEMLEMASMGAGVMHSRSIEFARKYGVPLMVRNASSDALGTWIVPEAEWMSEFPVSGAALAADEARLVLEGVPDRPGVSHAIFSAMASANIAVDMIGQSVGSGGKATIGFTVLNTDLDKSIKTLTPIVTELGATLKQTGKVSKVSVVGAGMRKLSGVAEKMFQALTDAGINMTMITTGDIKISVLIEEDTPEPEIELGVGDAAKEKIKKSHEENKKAVKGRKALRAVHAAFGLGKARKGAGDNGGDYKSKANAIAVPAAKDREAAIARLDGMEDVLIDRVELNAQQSRITIFDLPDTPGNCSKVFNAVATSGILVDMIVQNMTGPGRAELSFTVPKADLTRSLKKTQDVLQEIDTNCRVVGDSDVAVLYVLGVGMRTHTGVARTMFGALAERGINIAMINTSEVCIGVVIERTRGDEAYECLKVAFRVV
ncbi:aspartate kinase [soil metagenome]